MAKMEPNDLEKMLGNKESISKLMASPDAKALAAMLTKDRDCAQLEQAARSAFGGDMQSLKTLMRNITESPEGTELLRRLSENFQKP